MKGRRLVTAAIRWRTLGALLAGALLVAAPAAASLDVRVEAAAKRPPSQAAVAKQLAKRVTAARTPAARYRALLAVVKELHVPVFTTRQRLVLPGTRTLPARLQLYGFELRVLANALGRRDTIALEELASLLVAPSDDESTTLDPEQLRLALRAGVRAAAARPRAISSLVPLLVRELGLRQAERYDMLADVPAAKLRFDPVQTLLVVLEAAVARNRVSDGVAFDSARRPAAASSPCNSPLDSAIKDVSPLGKWLLAMFTKASPQVRALGVTLDAIHGPMLAFSVAYIGTSVRHQRSHYGPAGHEADAGKQMRFTVRVVMLDDLGDFVINCGALLGMKFPRKGPIPGVTILWRAGHVLSGLLHEHGTIEYVPEDGKTDANGEASLVFTPKTEVVPGFGRERHAQGSMTGVALYQSAFGNIPGSVAQFIFPKGKRDTTFGWDVTYHKPRGFMFAGLKWRVEMVSPNPIGPFNYTQFDVRDAHVCGESPYSSHWQIDAWWDNSWPYSRSSFSGLAGGHWNAIEGKRTPFIPSIANFGHRAEAEIVPGPRVRLSVEPISKDDQHATLASITPIAELQEDTRCPEND